MKSIQALWPKHVPKCRHYQIIVFDEMTVEKSESRYWGRMPEPEQIKYFIQKIYVTTNRQDWEDDIKELMVENPNCHMVAMVVDTAATITLKEMIEIPKILVEDA